VLLIFFALSYYIDCMKQKKLMEWLFIVLPIAIGAALFHEAVITCKISFFYDYWVERTIRMIPAFLFGAYCGKKKGILSKALYSKISLIIIRISAIAFLALATYLGDCFVTTILLYLCTLCLWFGCPNIKLKDNSIMRQATFLIYALHEGIIIVLLALMNKIGLYNLLTNRARFAGCLFTWTAIIWGGVSMLADEIVGRCSPKVGKILTGGRNKLR